MVAHIILFFLTQKPCTISYYFLTMGQTHESCAPMNPRSKLLSAMIPPTIPHPPAWQGPAHDTQIQTAAPPQLLQSHRLRPLRLRARPPVGRISFLIIPRKMPNTTLVVRRSGPFSLSCCLEFSLELLGSQVVEGSWETSLTFWTGMSMDFHHNMMMIPFWNHWCNCIQIHALVSKPLNQSMILRSCVNLQSQPPVVILLLRCKTVHSTRTCQTYIFEGISDRILHV